MANIWSQRVINSTTSLRGLVLRNTGAFVFEDPLHDTPSLVLRTTNPDMLHAITANTMAVEEFDVWQLGFAPTNLDMKGDYILEVYIPTNSIEYIRTTGSGTTRLFPNILQQEPTGRVLITALGATNVFASATSFITSQLTIEALGSGSVQFQVDKTLQADGVELSAASTGNLAIISQSTTSKEFIATATGPGSVFIGSADDPMGHSSLTVTDLVSKVYGAGDIVYMDLGGCNQSSVQTSGQGNVYASKIRCQYTDAVLLGSGDIFVQSAETLKSEDIGKGTLYALLDPTTLATGLYSNLIQRSSTPIYKRPFIPYSGVQSFPSNIGSVSETSMSTRVVPYTTASTLENTTTQTDIVFLCLGAACLLIALSFYQRYRLKRKAHVELRSTEKFATVATPNGGKSLSI